MSDVLIIQGDARRIPLADECVQCVVTSPPYWGLRRYEGNQGKVPFGLEPTIAGYVESTIEILREIRRVLRDDGVVFWNIGDSYASGAYSVRTRETLEVGVERHLPRNWFADANKIQRNGNAGLPPKNLILMPQRVAIAAQDDGWWVRSMIIWAKPNPMPESCKDRPTDSYELIIMLTKSERYFWDFDAVKEPANGNAHARGNGVNPKARKVNVPSGWETGNGKHEPIKKFSKGHRDPAEYRNKQNESFSSAVNDVVEYRNIRNVWMFTTQAYPGAHYATFPEEIPRRCITAASRVGDIVLDPFGGSGTTARVAVELNRRAVSIDLAYHDHAVKRTTNVQRKLVAV